jgi:hypothetical protein
LSPILQPDTDFLPSPVALGSNSRQATAIRFAALFIVFFVTVLILQWAAGCYSSELTGYPDEPAHLITGLMLSDYVHSGMKVSPMRFAEDYYLHYPKVGFGIWPPLFHFTEGLWFLMVPPSKFTAFALQALLTGLLAATLAFVAIECFGLAIGTLAGFAYVALPVVQIFTDMIMADVLMALLAFWSMLMMAAYARDGRTRQAAFLGILLGLALITKGNAAALAILPVSTLLLLRKYRGFMAPSFWLAAAIAGIIALPVEWMVAKIWTGTVEFIPYSASYALKMLQAHAAIYITRPGPVVLILALLGIYLKVIRPYFNRTLEPLWAAAISLIVSLFLFGLAPMPPEPRYHLASMAAIVLFAAAGLHWLAAQEFLKPVPAKARLPLLAGVATVAFVLTTFWVPPRASYGFQELAKSVLADHSLDGCAILISSEDIGEGLLVSEVALDEARPSHYVLRATKMLSRSRWNLDNYDLLYKTPQEMRAYLESVPVRIIVVDNSPGLASIPHHRLLKQMLETAPGPYQLAGTFPKHTPGAVPDRILVYRLAGNTRVPSDISVDMRYTLKKMLQ